MALLQEIIKRRGRGSGLKHLRISTTAYNHLKTLLALRRRWNAQSFSILSNCPAGNLNLLILQALDDILVTNRVLRRFRRYQRLDALLYRGRGDIAAVGGLDP